MKRAAGEAGDWIRWSWQEGEKNYSEVKDDNTGSSRTNTHVFGGTKLEAKVLSTHWPHIVKEHFHIHSTFRSLKQGLSLPSKVQLFQNSSSVYFCYVHIMTKILYIKLLFSHFSSRNAKYLMVLDCQMWEFAAFSVSE